MAHAEDILRQRMRITTPGQVTWAMLEATETCTACRHYRPHKEGSPEGRCGLIQSMYRKQGLLFEGADARACSQFEKGAQG